MTTKKGPLLAAILLVTGFSLTLAVAASAEPLVSSTPSAQGSASAKKALGRHFPGKVSAINQANKSFTLEVGTKKLVIVTNTATKFQTYSAGKKASSFEAVVVGGKVAVVGDLKGSTVSAKIVFVQPEKTSKRHADHGSVTALSSSSFTYRSSDKKNSIRTANITAATIFNKKVAGKMTRVSFSDLAIGDRVSFVGTLDSASGVITAKLVHIIPAATSSKTATSSAKP